MAFYDVAVSPSSEPTVITDTLTRHTGERDSLVMRDATRFLPDDLLLTWFNEGYASQYLRDYKRPERNKLTFQFGAKSDTLPILRLLNTHRAGDEISTWATLDASPTLDTLTYWISDTSLVSLDSITLEATYLRTDTLDNLVWGTDTLKFNMRPEKKKKEKKKKKKDDEEADTIPPVPHMELRMLSGSSQDLHKGLTLSAGSPVVRFDTAAIHLEIQVDTLWYRIVPPKFTRPEPLRPMVFTAPYKWEEGTKYRLTIDSAAVNDIYGLDNAQLVHEFTTKKSEDYSAISFNVSGLDGRKGIVEVLSSSDKPVASAPVNGDLATIRYLSPGTYYARLFIDANDDGEWTTGSITDSIQPEEVYYYPKKINLKKNWTIEQSWNINELPVDQQKPQEIKKNKPKRKKGDPEERPTDDEEEDEFFDDPFMNSATRSGNLLNGNGYNNNNDYRYRNY